MVVVIILKIINNIEANTFVLISNIKIPNIFIVSLELGGFNPEISISDYDMNKAQN